MDAEVTSFFVTAGRGTEKFAANEIMDKLIPSSVSMRDGKVFFELSSTSGLNIQQILELRSVERLFVAVTDYDNVSYTQTKRRFLDKLMSTLSQQQNFLNAKIVIDQLTLMQNKNDKFENKKCVLDLHNSFHVSKTDIALNRHHFTAHPRGEDLLGNRNVCIQPTNACPLTQDLKVSCDLDTEPVEKYIKLDISCSTSETMKEYMSESEQEKQILMDSSTTYSKQIDPNCEGQQTVHKTVDPSQNCNGPCQVCHSKCVKENGKESNSEGCVTFRVSVKCSGKVSKWINLKKLSRDLGWRVARATGWRTKLRHPQFEVCLHISDEHVTVGIPLTRFPLSRRVYMVDSGLRAPVAWIMSQLGCIKSGDIVLDPMCGKATILIEASLDVKDAWFIGSDSDLSQTDKALQNLNACGYCDTASLLNADGLNMPFRDNCVDVVLCDAPFNQNYVFELPSKTFYCRFINEISRILMPDGHCVLLISEQVKHIILDMLQGIERSQKIKGILMSEETLVFENENQKVCHKDTNIVIPLKVISSNYVKLGETHAYIIVLHKPLDLTSHE